MKSSFANPVVFVTHMQPFLIMWVLTVCFFVALAIAAVFSPGRRWYELGCIFLLAFVFSSVVGMVGTNLFVDVKMIDVEVISYRNLE